MDTGWQRADLWLRGSLPFFTAIILSLFAVVSWPVPYLGPVMPPLAFIALFYWSAHRPDLFPPAVSFFIGLLNDVLNDLPMGVSALLFTVSHQAICMHRRFFAESSFFILWAAFAIAVSIFMLLEWVLVSSVQWTTMPILPVIARIVIAILVFPLPCWAMIKLQRIVLVSE